MSNISDVRKKMLSGGDVFAGLSKIKNKDHRIKIEAERHNKWMDMKGVVKVCPVKWIKSFMIGRQKEYVENYLKRIIEGYGSVKHPCAKPYYESKNGKKINEFYKNAFGYLKRHY